MAQIVATIVVGPLLSMVKEKVFSLLVEQYNVMVGMEEQHKILKRRLPAILDIISDAEQAASHREGVKAWLEEIKTVAYEANEVFDEFKYEALCREAKKKGHYRELGFDAGYFEIQRWVCVSGDFDACDLARKICQSPVEDKEKVLQNLRKELGGKRYFVVLDDVWNRDSDKWGKLKACLQHGGAGSVLLVTTRNKETAQLMHTVEAHHITVLDKKFIEEIIQKRAFGLQQSKPSSELLAMIVEFAERCDGSPLAAKALGSVLRAKTSLEEWKAVLHKSVICSKESGILQILKLSFDDLSSHMKQCFAFCSMFPKDYEIDVGKLIQIWIANGFIQEQKHVHPETIGKQVEEHASRLRRTHLSTELGELKQLNLADHLELHQLENVTEVAAKAANLRSKKELRELTFKWTIGHENDASVLEGLKPHDDLQSVRIDSYGATTFPSWMSMLENLVEIHIFDCENLQFISTRFVTFPNLKEFTLENLLCLERWWEINSEGHGEEIVFPQLEKLFVINCAKLTALPDAALLGEPCGTMIRSAFPALKVLKLRRLYSFLRWEAFEGTQKERIMFPQLEKLSIRDCPALTALSETPLGGDYSMFPQLEKLSVSYCSAVTALSEAPPGGDYSMARSAFPALKVLKLNHLESFQRWDTVEETQGEEIMFPQLEKLIIKNCGKLTALLGKPTFPNLHNVCIEECPQLTTIAISPKLNALELQGCEKELLLWVARHETSLVNLKLQNLEDTEITSAMAEHCLSQVLESKEKWNHEFSLTVMELSGFKYGVAELCGCFVELQELNICQCDALVHWPEKEFQRLVSLRKLSIISCRKLTGFAQAPPEASTSERSQLLPSLEYMFISKCENLVEIFNVPASLKTMTIDICSKVEYIFSRRLQQGKSASLVLQGSSIYSEVSSSSAGVRAEHFLLPCLEDLFILGCHSLTGALDLPSSLRELTIIACSELRSLESHSGELRSLEHRLRTIKLKFLDDHLTGRQAPILFYCRSLVNRTSKIEFRFPNLKSTRAEATVSGKIDGVRRVRRLGASAAEHGIVEFFQMGSIRMFDGQHRELADVVSGGNGSADDGEVEEEEKLKLELEISLSKKQQHAPASAPGCILTTRTYSRRWLLQPIRLYRLDDDRTGI
ncbi:hypothetical protein ACQ4PT_062293 [Festuca glaucescens]